MWPRHLEGLGTDTVLGFPGPLVLSLSPSQPGLIADLLWKCILSSKPVLCKLTLRTLQADWVSFIFCFFSLFTFRQALALGLAVCV